MFEKEPEATGMSATEMSATETPIAEEAPGAASRDEFGELLRRHRCAAKLTQEALAERAGVSPRGIRALERGASKPHKETAHRLAAALALPEEARARFFAAAAPLPRSAPEHARPGAPLAAEPLTTLVGRLREAAEVKALLQRADLRIVSLAGPGGVGKSRLALQVAAALRPAFPDGVVFVPLAPLGHAGLVLATIAAALGLQEIGAQPLQGALAAFLRGKRTLLVLDNFEHVSEAAREVAALVSASPHLRLLITSRVPLHVQGEQIFQVPPLELPTADAQLLPEIVGRADAVSLFVQRARLVKHDFILDAGNAAAVAAIVRRLDGLPLAIELAAARAALLSPHALLERMERPLRLLTGGARDLPERHRTFYNTVAWSYQLLSPAEQTLFRRLAVFAGGCTQAAAEHVCRAAGEADALPAGDDLLDLLAALVEKCLLSGTEQAEAGLRFDMLATIREFGLEQLAASGEGEAMRRRHAEYYLRYAEAAVSHLYEADQMRWLERLDAELDNLRTAFAWALEQGRSSDAAALEEGLRVSGSLFAYWHLRGRHSEAQMWLGRLLAEPAAAARTAGRSRALRASASFKAHTGERAAAYAQSRESLAIAQELGDVHELAEALYTLGVLDVSMSPPDALLHGGASRLEESLFLMRKLDDQPGTMRALLWLGFRLLRSREAVSAAARFAEGLEIAQARGDRWSSAIALTGLAEATWFLGDAVKAKGYALRSLALHEALDDRHGCGHTLGLLGDLAQAEGNVETAYGYYLRCLATLREMGEAPRSVRTLLGLATLAAAADEPGRALRLAGAAASLSQTALIAAYAPDDARLAQIWSKAEQLLSPAEQSAAWMAGQALSLDEAIALALGG